MPKFEGVGTTFLKILSYYRNRHLDMSHIFYFFYQALMETSRNSIFPEDRPGNSEKKDNVFSRKEVPRPVSLDPGAPGLRLKHSV